MTPETSGEIYWEDMTLDEQLEVVAGKRNARRQEPSSQEISIDGLIFDDDDDDEIEGTS